jgi:hypothetical protein
LIKTAWQHLLLLIGFDTLIYQKYYDTPPILVGHQGDTLKVRWRVLSGFVTLNYWTTQGFFPKSIKIVLEYWNNIRG